MADQNNSLVRNANSMTQASSLDDLMRETENVFLLIDTSGSMGSPIDVNEPKRCIDALREVVREIRAEGHVPMIAFGGDIYNGEVRFVDEVPEPSGGTPLHTAIAFAKQYGATRLVVISDGMPDAKSASLEEARTFGGRIDIMFVGGKDDWGGGRAFLEQLAKSTGGGAHQGSLKNVKQLSKSVIGLLGGEVEEKRAVISGPGFTAEESDLIEEAEEVEDDDDFEDGDDDEDEDEDGDDN